jgi:hypothetical protein
MAVRFISAGEGRNVNRSTNENILDDWVKEGVALLGKGKEYVEDGKTESEVAGRALSFPRDEEDTLNMLAPDEGACASCGEAGVGCIVC